MTPVNALFSSASDAYARTRLPGLSGPTSGPTQNPNGGADFGAMMSEAIHDTVALGHSAEAQAASGLNGQGDVTQIVTAVSNAQLTLQTGTVIRDRMVQAYQDIMKMAI